MESVSSAVGTTSVPSSVRRQSTLQFMQFAYDNVDNMDDFIKQFSIPAPPPPKLGWASDINDTVRAVNIKNIMSSNELLNITAAPPAPLNAMKQVVGLKDDKKEVPVHVSLTSNSLAEEVTIKADTLFNAPAYAAPPAALEFAEKESLTKKSSSGVMTNYGSLSELILSEGSPIKGGMDVLSPEAMAFDADLGLPPPLSATSPLREVVHAENHDDHESGEITRETLVEPVKSENVRPFSQMSIAVESYENTTRIESMILEAPTRPLSVKTIDMMDRYDASNSLLKRLHVMFHENAKGTSDAKVVQPSTETEASTVNNDIIPTMDLYVYSIDGRCVNVTVSRSATIGMLKRQAAALLTLEQDLSYYAITIDSDSKGVIIPDEKITFQDCIDSSWSNFRVIFERILPKIFSVKVQIEEKEEPREALVSLFTSVGKAVNIIKPSDPSNYTLFNSDSLLDGLEFDETPFSATPTTSNYVVKLKRRESLASTKNLVSVFVYGGFKRVFPLPVGANSSHLIYAFTKSLGISAKLTESFRVGYCDDSYNVTAVFLPEGKFEQNDYKLCLVDSNCKILHVATLDYLVSRNEFFAENEEPKDVRKTNLSVRSRNQTRDNKVADAKPQQRGEDPLKDANLKRDSKSGLFSSQELKTILQDQPSEEQSSDSEFDDIITRPLQQLSQIEITGDSITQNDKDNENLERKRIGKLSNMLGIDKNDDIAKLLLETTKTSASKIGNMAPTKSAHKVAKLLGVTDASQNPRERKISQYHSRGSLPMMRVGRKKTYDESFDKRSQEIDGSFDCKIYFANKTFKSINIPVDTTVQKLIMMLIEKLNIKEGLTYYGIFEDRGSSERQLEPNEVLYHVMSGWKGDNIFLFKKKRPKGKASMDSVLSNRSDTSLPSVRLSSPKISMASRRAAKIANMLGINEKKNSIQVESPEVKTILKMLNTMGKQKKDDEMSMEMNIVRLFKEGWLVKEESLGLSRSVWCKVENQVFYCFTKANQENDVALLKLDLKIFSARRSKRNKNDFEFYKKGSENFASYFFNADSVKACETWLKAVEKAQKMECETQLVLHSVPIEQELAATESNTSLKALKSKKERVSMDDFEFHKVIGKGKFGKVLMCSQKSSGKVYAIKCIKKSAIENETLLISTKNENNILRSIKHPFIVELYYAFQTPEYLNLVLEYVNGGELFFHVCNFGRFSEERARFYAAELSCAFECLHERGIVYRDMKLENILLDKDGHIKLTDFGLSRHADESDPDDVIGGTFEYLAPEVILGQQHVYASDWWSYGLVVYEMICGFHPVYCDDKEETVQRIVNFPIDYPSFISKEAYEFLSELLVRDPLKRLGHGQFGAKNVQKHPFLSSFNYEKLLAKEIEPPFKPDIVDDFDVKFFDAGFTEMPTVLTLSSLNSFVRDNTEAFTQYSYRGDK